MLKTDVLLNIFVNTVIYFFQDSLNPTEFNRTAFKKRKKKKYSVKKKVFTVTFDQFNVSSLNKSIHLFFLKKSY